MTTNVFVPGLDDFLRGELETLADLGEVRFHPLLDLETLIEDRSRSFDDLLERARAELDGFDGSVDAIIAHWDFPTSILVPTLCHEYGIPAPSIESLVLCEHKYASRRMQAEVAPECVPAFDLFDPEDPDALDGIDLEFPFFVKPVKGHSSQLSFKVQDAEEFANAVHEIRGGRTGMADTFDDVMRRADLPEWLQGVHARMCLAEQLMDGEQAAPEGSMVRGAFAVHGIFDQPHLPGDQGYYSRLDYPSAMPQEIQDRMVDVAERVIRRVGFDDGCFNVEFMWDEERDKLWLIEVNTRISQSHSDLFAKVDGRSNHKIALDVALGREPTLPGDGRFACASKILLTYEQDGIVDAVPGEPEIDRLREEFPETEVRIEVAAGDRLSEIEGQDPNRYKLAEVFLGANDRVGLERGHRLCEKVLTFDIRPPEDA